METWQRVDRRNGLVQPWLTHDALDEICRWPLADMTVLEWGGGQSTLWWSTMCRQVVTLETDMHWCDRIGAQLAERGAGNVRLEHRTPYDMLWLPEERFDVVVIDCDPVWLRKSCLDIALGLPRPLIIIHDNWQQEGFEDAGAAAMVAGLPVSIYKQAGHPSWQTAIWKLD